MKMARPPSGSPSIWDGPVGFAASDSHSTPHTSTPSGTQVGTNQPSGGGSNSAVLTGSPPDPRRATTATAATSASTTTTAAAATSADDGPSTARLGCRRGA